MDLRDFFKEVKLGEEDFTAMQKEDQIKVSNWNKSGGKYIAVVSDSEHVPEDNARYKYLASYVTQNDKVIGVKLQRFKKDREGNLLPVPEEFNIPFKQANKLASFLEFLKKANLGSLTSESFQLVDKLKLDPELYSKLVTLSSDEGGRQTLLKLISEGYLQLDLNLPDLIKIGLSGKNIDTKLKVIEDFESFISNPEIKEIDIQSKLSEMPWIFGPEYVGLDVRTAGYAGIPDRRLRRIDGLSDILEIKLPNAELLRIDDKNRQYIAPDLAEAVGQLTGYLEYFYSEYRTERDDETDEEILKDTFGHYYKPRGILLIGRRDKSKGTKCVANTNNAEPKHLRRLVSYFHWIDVLTYDDLIERAQNGLRKILEEK